MLDKVKQGFKKFGNKVVAVFAGGAVMATSAISAFAAEGGAGTASEGVSAAKNLLETASGSLNIGNVVAIIGAGIGAVVGLFLAWWGARKLVRMLVSALKKGKVAI